MRDKDTGLTYKELSIADAYLNNGFHELKAFEASAYSQNCTEASKRGNATKILKKPHIAVYIKQKVAELKTMTVASRKERQAFWSKVMHGEVTRINKDGEVENLRVSLSDRLKASELLGRSDADFTDNLRTTDVVEQRKLESAESAEVVEIAKVRVKQFVNRQRPAKEA